MDCRPKGLYMHVGEFVDRGHGALADGDDRGIAQAPGRLRAVHHVYHLGHQRRLPAALQPPPVHHRTPKQKPQNRTGGFDEQEGDEVGLELGDGGAHGSGGDGEVEDELLGAGEAAPRAGVALAELEPGLGEDLRAARDAGGGEERGEKEGGEDGAGRRHDGGGCRRRARSGRDRGVSGQTALALEPRELVWLGFEPGGGRVGNRPFVAVGGNRLPNGRR